MNPALLIPLITLGVELISGGIAGGAQQEQEQKENDREDLYNANNGQHLNAMLQKIMAPIGDASQPYLGDAGSMATYDPMNPMQPMGTQGKADAQGPMGGIDPSMLAGLFANMPQQGTVTPPGEPSPPMMAQGAGMEGAGMGGGDILSMIASGLGGLPGMVASGSPAGALGGAPGMMAQGGKGAAKGGMGMSTNDVLGMAIMGLMGSSPIPSLLGGGQGGAQGTMGALGPLMSLLGGGK